MFFYGRGTIFVMAKPLHHLVGRIVNIALALLASHTPVYFLSIGVGPIWFAFSCIFATWLIYELVASLNDNRINEALAAGDEAVKLLTQDIAAYRRRSTRG